MREKVLEISKIETIEEALLKAKAQLLINNPFFYHVLQHLRIVPDKNLNVTFAIDADGTLYYNPDHLKTTARKYGMDYVVNLLIYGLAHETLHYILLHVQRIHDLITACPKITHQIANLSADCIVNSILALNGIQPLPRIIPLKDSEIEINATVQPKVDHHGNVIVNIGPLTLHNPHKMSLEEIAFTLLKWNITLPQEELDVIPSKSCKHTPSELYNIINTAILQSKGMGKEPLGLDRLVNEIYTPRVNWHKLLSEFLVTTYHRRKYSLNPPDPVALLYRTIKRTLTPTRNLNALIVVDTSGSISKKILDYFVSYARQILNSLGISKVYFASADAEIQTLQEIRSKLPDNLKLKGEGGTDFRPAFNLARRLRVQSIIYLTDGEGIYPQSTTIPTAWILPYYATAKPPFGKVIKLPPIPPQ